MRIIFFLLLLTLMISSCKSKQERAGELLLSGNKALKDNDLPLAEKLFRQSLELNDQYPDAYNNLGIIRHREKKFYEAIAFYDLAIQYDPNFLMAYVNRSAAFFETAQYQLALFDLRKVEKVVPDTFHIPYSKGLIFTQLKKYDSALQVFSKILEPNPTNGEILTHRGTIYYYKGEYENSEQDLMAALKIDIENGDALNALSLVYLETGKIDRAEECIKSALRINPKDSYYHNNYGFIYLHKGQPDSAVVEINQSIVLDPDNGWAYRNKALYYLQIKNFDEAWLNFDLASKKNGNIEKLYSYWADAYYQKGEISQACEKLRKAKELKEDYHFLKWKKDCGN